MKTRDESIIEHILRYCEQIQASVERFGNSFEIFEKDADYRQSVAMSIMQIGELCIRLSDEFKDKNVEIPWENIRGMRNMFAHQYEIMTLEVVWRTALKDIPKLGEFCKKFAR